MAESHSNELWLPVVGYEGIYLVSDQGRVRSEPSERTVGKILSPRYDRWGYRGLQLTKNREVRSWLVHRLVVIAFLGDIPKGREVNHKNGDKSDNRLVNLEVVTHSENCLHAIRVLGVHRSKTIFQKGMLHRRAKLTEDAVLDIRSRRATCGVPFAVLAKEYGVTPDCIGRIVRRERWAHI